MKIFIAALLLVSGSVFAQGYGQRPTVPQGFDRAPDQATGPGIVHNYQIPGTVISVTPEYRNMPVGQNCQQQYQQNNSNSSLNPGTVLGALIGGAAGSTMGKGRGREAMIGIGAATGAIVGNNSYQSGQQYQGSPQCTTIMERQLVGWHFVMRSDNMQALQLRGWSETEVRVGDARNIIVHAMYFPGMP